MQSVSLHKIVQYCDQMLRTTEVADHDRAFNGLQVENRNGIQRIAAAVDASLATIRLAIEAKASLLVVHHGLFWSAMHPWTSTRYEAMRLLLENDLAIYSSHLPLDVHPKLGNNARLCSELGLRELKPFFFERGQHIGLQCRKRISISELQERVKNATGAKTLLIPGGPNNCQRIGVVTGGAGSEVKKAAAEGVDTFITGEGPHWTYSLAEELGINVIYGGHYATETFGVKALSEHLSGKFKLPWTFLDHPTGL